MSTRRTLLELFDAALRAVDGRTCVARYLKTHAVSGNVALFAVGKAASAMTRGALDELRRRVTSALVITKDGHVDPELRRDSRIAVQEAAHPVPDERSLAAGAALEGVARALPADVLPIFLISGGSSSLVESLQPGVALEDLRKLNERGLAAGWDIARLNRERSALSALKGGGISRLLNDRKALALFVSDVPGDDPDVIGSGLLGASGGFDRVERRIVANVDFAVRAAVEAATARGLNLEPHAARFDAAAATVAREFVAALRDTDADGLVWGGESTVTLPERPGRGGRNTHLALAAARLLRADEGLTILAAGTDGTDGPTEDAGAIVDAGTIERAEISGCDVERAYREFDSGTALEASGDLVHTGPTGTNVGDLLIGLKRSATSARDAARGHML
jgi:hydroxypyruvate reductase